MEGPKQRQSEAMQGRDGGLTTAELAGARPPSENQAARERARAQQPQPQQPMPAAQPPEEHSGPLFFQGRRRQTA
jgi:hypothetical protein